MGKWTVQHTEEILLGKLRASVLDAIENHKNEKRQEGDARPITFDEFVQLYDPRDSFTAKLIEVLVKEYSERRAKATPVDRKFQIATRTSAALGAIPRDAMVYNNSGRWGRWARRNRIFSNLRRQLEEDEPNTRPPARTDEEVTISTSERDQLFQSALEELEDGEFGVYLDSSLHDVYAEQESLSRARRRRENLHPILHDITMETWPLSADPEEAGPIAASGYSSSRGSDPEGHFSRSFAPQPQSRNETLVNSFVGRHDSQRSSLLRRGSIRRNWYNRTGSLSHDRPPWRPFTLDIETARPSGSTEMVRSSPLWELPSSRTIPLDSDAISRGSRPGGPSGVMSPRPVASTSTIGNTVMRPYLTPSPDWNNSQPALGRTRWDMAWPGDGPDAIGTDALLAAGPMTDSPVLPSSHLPAAPPIPPTQPEVPSSDEPSLPIQTVDDLP